MALRALNVDPDELSLVRALFFHHFFQGFGIALLTIIAIDAFLKQFSGSDLPMVYMITAIVLLCVGRVYSYLENRLSLQKLFPVVALAVALLAVTGWFGLKLAHTEGMNKTVQGGWLIFSLMVLYRVVYLLGSLEFWGLSAVVFDVRQSKRLFGLISSGYVPAKLLGYMSVSVLAPYVSNDNIFGIGAASFVISFFFLRWAIKKANLGDSHEAHSHGNADSAGIISRLFGSRFVLALALLSFVVVLVLTTIDYSFLSALKYKSKKDVNFAAFLGMFFAIGQGITIFLEIFLSGRIVDRVGVRGSLLFLPIALLLICLALVVENSVWHIKYAEFWFFGIMILTCDVLHYVLNGPVFLAMFQPLDRHRRLQAHTVVKGLMDPLSLGFAGVVLYLLIQFQGGEEKKIPLDLLGYFLLGMMILWILAIVFVNRKYLEMLKQAIQNRYLAGSQLEITDKTSIDILKNKLESDYAEEVVYTLDLLRNVDLENFHEIVVELIEHPDDDVVVHSLQLIEEMDITEAREKLSEMIERNESGHVTQAALRAFCRISPEDLEIVIPFLESTDHCLRSGAIEGLLFYGGVEGIVSGGQELLGMIDSPDEEQRALAAQTIGQLGIQRLYRPLEQLFKDPAIEVKREAIRASAKVKNPKLVRPLLDFLNDNSLRRDAVNVIPAMGPTVIQEIQDQFGSHLGDAAAEKYDLIEICGRVGSDEAIELLLKWSDDDGVEDRDACYRALHLNRFHAPNSSQWSKRLEQVLDNAHDDLLALTIIKRNGQSEISQSALLAQALTEELSFASSRLFVLLSFLYDRIALIETQRELETANKERRANALETLDNMLPKNISDRFFVLIENSFADTNTEPTHHSKAEFQTSADVVSHVLTSGQSKYSRWTIAAAMDAVRKLKQENLIGSVLSFAEHRKDICRETAVCVLQELATDENVELKDDLRKKIEMITSATSASESKLLEIEKVIILKTSPLFSETPNEILVDVAHIVTEERFAKGQQIFAVNDAPDEMYIIYAGEVRISHAEKTVAVLKRRDIFGELALLDPEPRSATATAETDCLLLRLDRGPFFELMDERNEVGRGVLKVMCRRLRNNLEKIKELEAQVNKSVKSSD